MINNKLFTKFDFWKELIKYNIIEEMFNQKKYNLFSNKKEEEEKNKERIKEIAISKINLHINYMIDFKCKYSFMKQILQEFKELYELSDEEIKKINDKIKEYNKCQENENEEKAQDKKDIKEDKLKLDNIDNINEIKI